MKKLFSILFVLLLGTFIAHAADTHRIRIKVLPEDALTFYVRYDGDVDNRGSYADRYCSDTLRVFEDVAKPGQEIEIRVDISDSGYKQKQWTENGLPMSHGKSNTYDWSRYVTVSFTMPDEDVELVGIFEYAPDAPTYQPGSGSWDPETGTLICDNGTSDDPAGFNYEEDKDKVTTYILGGVTTESYYFSYQFPNMVTLDLSRTSIKDFYYSDKCERNKDFIYFYDHSISRSASKREFMLSVIESEFSGKMSQSVNLQPMVIADNKKIYGAEILLRINDVHRNVFFSAQDIARIALQENKTHLITESIVNYVGTLYKENGSTVFKINDFRRVAINIDQTYFKNPDLIKSIIDIYNNYHLPANFLSFEIPEEMIPDNIDKIRAFAKELASIHIVFSCDRYSGHYVGIEKLKELGFKEIKVMKGVIDNIDKDPQKLNAFKMIADTAKEQGIGISVVGVENEAQYRLLRDIDKNMLLQGYYFYKPLTRSDFLSAIISYN